MQDSRQRRWARQSREQIPTNIFKYFILLGLQMFFLPKSKGEPCFRFYLVCWFRGETEGMTKKKLGSAFIQKTSQTLVGIQLTQLRTPPPPLSNAAILIPVMSIWNNEPVAYYFNVNYARRKNTKRIFFTVRVIHIFKKVISSVIEHNITTILRWKSTNLQIHHW